jgi:hypothetical protein
MCVHIMKGLTAVMGYAVEQLVEAEGVKVAGA